MNAEAPAGLVAHLMSRHKISRVQAEYRAQRIVQEQAKRAGERKVKLERAQLTLGFDGTPAGEEPASKWDQDSSVPF